jgi:hypothetical protein
MPGFLKNKWIVSSVIFAITIATAIFLFLKFSGKDHIYLKINGVGCELIGAHVISNNLKIGEVSKELNSGESESRIFQIRFDQAVNIPINSEIHIRQSVIDSSCTVFLTFIPSREYYSKGDTIFILAEDYEAPPIMKKVLVSDTLNPVIEPVSIKRETPVKPVKMNAEEGKSDEKEIVFMLQLLASKEPMDEKSLLFKGIDSIIMIREEGWYKYFTCQTTSFDEVTAHRERITRLGRADVFVVAYKGSHRISVKEARALKK